MPGWTLIDTHPTKGRIFQRPLDATDLRYVWRSLFNGSGDGMHHVELHLANGSRDAHLFSSANIVRAWLSTKRRYPLLGATLQGHNAPLRLNEPTNSKADGGTDGGTGDGDENDIGFASHPHFVVREHDLSALRPGEIIFGEVAGPEEARQWADSIFNGPRLLSEDLLIKFHVFRETNSNRTGVIHLVMSVAHCVADRLAVEAFLRCLFDTLARGGSSDSEPAQLPLEDRLAMEIPLVEFEPVHLRSLSPPVRRWRRVAGAVISRLRWSKLQGGHTLPWHLTRSTPHVAARHSHAIISLTQAQSTVVLANCRLHNITFGNTFYVLAQVAMTRVLYRRYLRGEISEEEWTYRKRQPHITAGPINLRPRLDKTWYDRGGGGEVLSLVGLFCYQLPFMPLGAAMEKYPRREDNQEYDLSDGAPPFSDLLTFNRFLHRTRLITKQATALLNHPLFFEIILGGSQIHVTRARFDTLQWMKHVDAGDGSSVKREEDEVLPVADMPMVAAHRGSSVGNIDLIAPSEYPLPPTHPLSPYSPVPHPLKAGYVTPPSSPLPGPPSTSEVDLTPKIIVDDIRAQVHVCPAEILLGSSSSGGRLSVFVYYDSNVFEEGVVREWLDEIRGAALWYLGRTHTPLGHALQSYGGDSGRSGLGEGMRAKL